MGKRDLWKDALTKPEKARVFSRGDRSLRDFFRFVTMTVNEFVIMRSHGAIPLIDRVKQYMEDHLEDETSCSQLAKALRMSPDYLNRQFRLETGQTLKRFMIQYKLSHAEHLIRLTQLPISEVAARIGYSHFSHFSDAFKKLYRESPQEYRKNAQKESQR